MTLTAAVIVHIGLPLFLSERKKEYIAHLMTRYLAETRFVEFLSSNTIYLIKRQKNDDHRAALTTASSPSVEISIRDVRSRNRTVGKRKYSLAKKWTAQAGAASQVGLVRNSRPRWASPPPLPSQLGFGTIDHAITR
jgi:hypothetical protein